MDKVLYHVIGALSTYNAAQSHWKPPPFYTRTPSARVATSRNIETRGPLVVKAMAQRMLY